MKETVFCIEIPLDQDRTVFLLKIEGRAGKLVI